MPRDHLFVFDNSLFQSISEEEVAATVEGLKTLDLYRLPYPQVAIQITYHHFRADDGLQAMRNHFPELYPHVKSDGALDETYRNMSMIIHGLTIDTFRKITMEHPGDEHWKPFQLDVTHRYRDVPSYMRDVLIVLLATRNASKSTVRNKLAGLGIGKRRSRWEYTTTISIPAPDQITESEGTGTSRRPHLRRGHIRRQRHGPSRQFVKLRWIEPTFVNADAEFVNTRTAYNLTKSGEPA